jgi:hypothetical protein
MFLNQMESGGEGPCFVAVGAGGVADDVGDVVMAGNTGEDGVVCRRPTVLLANYFSGEVTVGLGRIGALG